MRSSISGAIAALSLLGATFSAPAQVMSGSVTSSGQILWRDIEAGMTVARLRGLYPVGGHVEHKASETLLEEVRITPRCEARAHIHHPAGIVDRVVLRGGGSLTGRCAVQVLDALSARYGRPLLREQRRGILPRSTYDYVWNSNGIMIVYRRTGNNELGGGGLLRASWEITYLAIDTSVDI